MAIWTCRHAPAAVEGVCYGRSNVPLTLAAGPASDLVVERLGAVRPAAVWTSPLARARDLAEQVALRLGVPMHADARLSEIDFGLWEGLPFAEIERRDRDRFLRWQAAWEFLPAPGGESLHELQDRVEAWYKGRLTELEGADVLVVTHAGTIRALRAHVLGTLFEEELRTDVQLPASAGQVLLDGEDLSALPAPLRTRKGLGRAFQLTQLFPNLSVLENVRLAVQAREQGRQQMQAGGAWKGGLDLFKVWLDRQSWIDEALALLRQVQLAERVDLGASYGV